MNPVDIDTQDTMQQKWTFISMLYAPKIHNISLVQRKTSVKCVNKPSQKSKTIQQRENYIVAKVKTALKNICQEEYSKVFLKGILKREGIKQCNLSKECKGAFEP